MSVIENIVNTLNLIYVYVPKELVIVILGSLVLFVILELGDRKRKKEWGAMSRASLRATEQER